MTMDATEIALVRKTFETALDTAGDDAVPLLSDLGWEELYNSEPVVATAELFEAQGRLWRTTNALDVLVAMACGEAPAPGTAVVHPGLVRWDRPPGRLLADGTLHIDGLVLAGLERAGRIFVPFDDGDGLGVAAFDVAAARINIRPAAGLDPSLHLTPLTVTAPLPAGAAWPVSASWATVTLTARRALAHELCGLAQAMLDQAVAHVTDRRQFDRPIGAFQTVRHRLTEVLVALASARAALDASWRTGEPLLGDAAKALAGKAHRLAAGHCLQVTGAIGFTEEYALSARIRRGSVLDSLYGSTDGLTARIGGRLLADPFVPRLHSLP